MGLVRGEGLEIITPIRGRKLFEFEEEFEDIDEFRNNNPDKGTETFGHFTDLLESDSLEIITPIRGRKRTITLSSNPEFLRRFRNNNPDKGTETSSWSFFLNS